MSKQPFKWLDRRIAAPGPFLTLCLTEAEFLAAMKHCKIANPPAWIKTAHAHATTHFLNHEDGAAVCVVTLRGYSKRHPVEVAGLLVHEAVHVWQEYIERIGEKHPASEQEAYAIQTVSQELMAEFARRVEAGLPADA